MAGVEAAALATGKQYSHVQLPWLGSRCKHRCSAVWNHVMRQPPPAGREECLCCSSAACCLHRSCHVYTAGTEATEDGTSQGTHAGGAGQGASCESCRGKHGTGEAGISFRPYTTTWTYIQSKEHAGWSCQTWDVYTPTYCMGP